MLEPMDLEQIIDTDADFLQLEGYINDATVFAASLNITSELVIKYLAAHLVASTRDRTVKSEEAGGAKIEYEGVFGEGLKATVYGQAAIEFDTTGALRNLYGVKLKEAKMKAL